MPPTATPTTADRLGQLWFLDGTLKDAELVPKSEKLHLESGTAAEGG